jgi:hypothetical protein
MSLDKPEPGARCRIAASVATVIHMPAPPLTHHEILGLVEPFARRGRHVDLAATDRVARRIAFKPVAHAAGGPGQPPLQETLQLESLGTGSFKLLRTVARPDGVKASLQASGDDPAAMLTRFEQVPLQQHFDSAAGHVIARSYQFAAFIGSKTDAANPSPPLLRHGEVQLDGLQLAFDISAVRGVSAEITLTPVTGQPLWLPQDLLAVLGWDWARLITKQALWTSRYRLRGDGARRTASAEQALVRATVHLSRVLAEPPSTFHTRHLAARWGVVARRSIPTLTALGMIGGVFLLPRLAPNQDPGVWLALHYAPIALLAVAFGLQELPQFEIPPLPRPLRRPDWREPATVGAATANVR